MFFGSQFNGPLGIYLTMPSANSTVTVMALAGWITAVCRLQLAGEHPTTKQKYVFKTHKRYIESPKKKVSLLFRSLYRIYYVTLIKLKIGLLPNKSNRLTLLQSSLILINLNKNTFNKRSTRTSYLTVSTL